jgi:hypothetical protein
VQTTGEVFFMEGGGAKGEKKTHGTVMGIATVMDPVICSNGYLVQ